MPKNNQTDPRRNFAPLILPWLLGALMLAVYVLSLNRWVTMLNLGVVSQVSGFVWQPQLYNPLTYLATLPFQWLSPAAIPVALNLFSAVCAALGAGHPGALRCHFTPGPHRTAASTRKKRLRIPHRVAGLFPTGIGSVDAGIATDFLGTCDHLHGRNV